MFNIFKKMKKKCVHPIDKLIVNVSSLVIVDIEDNTMRVAHSYICSECQEELSVKYSAFLKFNEVFKLKNIKNEDLVLLDELVKSLSAMDRAVLLDLITTSRNRFFDSQLGDIPHSIDLQYEFLSNYVKRYV